MSERDLLHFVDLARQGKLPGASGGEKAAAAIALVMVDKAVVLDRSARRGFEDWFQHLQADPEEAARSVGLTF